MSTRKNKPEDVKVIFDVDKPTDFYRWATPILLHIIKYGKEMKKPPFKTHVHRAVFRKVIGQMMCMGYWAVEEGLSDEDKITVYKWYETWGKDTAPDVDLVIHQWENILTRWYDELAEGK
ncbi:hypothetical protein NKR19_g200 [Coniochaeta hoffmannii]|uniref:Uncharacterized protein n=1 Tax=Coniochaeta hoffmannii TaxID=91930 RepID=A0AA38SER0_9PEZI|nr:hypothetical protein NKR19_g200 [Coniochaeta hoffmannii]